MAVMFGQLFKALKEANVNEDLAISAAEEVAQYETKIGGIESDVRLMKWMLGTVIVLLIMLIAANLTVLFRLSGT